MSAHLIIMPAQGKTTRLSIYAEKGSEGI